MESCELSGSLGGERKPAFYFLRREFHQVLVDDIADMLRAPTLHPRDYRRRSRQLRRRHPIRRMSPRICPPKGLGDYHLSLRAFVATSIISRVLLGQGSCGCGISKKNDGLPIPDFTCNSEIVGKGRVLSADVAEHPVAQG